MSDDEPIGPRGAATGTGVFSIPGSGGRIVVQPEPGLGRAIGDAIVVAGGRVSGTGITTQPGLNVKLSTTVQF